MPDPDYRALCAELLDWTERTSSDYYKQADVILRARAALAQPEPVVELAAKLIAESKPMDPEMAAALTTEARWGLYEGSLTPHPEPVAPTDEELLELMPQQMRDDLATAARAMIGFDNPKADYLRLSNAAAACRIILNRHAVDHARAVLARYGTPANNTRGTHFDD